MYSQRRRRWRGTVGSKVRVQRERGLEISRIEASVLSVSDAFCRDLLRENEEYREEGT